ncbi:hypothetical protein BDQ12DRAFT_636225 [Crucibulum laeve]|uniref:Uncharacterized protein n=1 Tax=Crucibulum laeve TaxID=68775 RepID=A0A5C3LP51_9AGAR|nr:hypothetical protein BDQ12DRAFT_636225 [Crucibulum laeve]
MFASAPSSFKFSALALVGFLFLTSSLVVEAEGAPLRSRRSKSASYANIARQDSGTSATSTASATTTTPTSSSALSASQSQKLTLTPQQPALNFDVTAPLYTPSSSLVTLPDVPANCAIYASISPSPSSECTGSMTATNVTFDDCGDAFTICRCENAEMSLSTAVDRLGKVPVGLRRYVNTVVVVPLGGANETAGDGTSAGSPHAYTLTSGDIHFFGDVQQASWIHESGHAYDYASGTPHSGSEEWLGAIGNDTRAPDTYGTNNAVEEFAQMTVLQVYLLTHENTMPPGYSADCMSHQLAFMASLPLFNATTLFANTCEVGENDGARHTTGPAFVNGGLRVLPVPPVPADGAASGAPIAVPSPAAAAAMDPNGRKNAAVGVNAPTFALFMAVGLVVGVAMA